MKKSLEQSGDVLEEKCPIEIFYLYGYQFRKVITQTQKNCLFPYHKGNYTLSVKINVLA